MTPQQAGLPATTGRRRTAGLRRAEVAILAGLSIEYYTRLEQGMKLLPGIEQWPAQRRNTARYTFLHAEGGRLYDNWDEVAAATVAHLRAAAGAHPDDPDLTSLIGELVVKSTSFAALWERYNVPQTVQSPGGRPADAQL